MVRTVDGEDDDDVGNILCAVWIINTGHDGGTCVDPFCDPRQPFIREVTWRRRSGCKWCESRLSRNINDWSPKYLGAAPAGVYCAYHL